jgi:membrane protein implicated in regulation of membrane protease activity
MAELGVMLVLAGVALLIAEAHLPAGGALGAGGVGALAAGCWLVIVAAGGGVAVALPAAAAIVLIGAIAGWAVARRVTVARRTPVVRGAGLAGRTAVVRSWAEPDGGQVATAGTLWRARRAWPQDDAPSAGDTVVVEDVDGLTLTVRAVEPWELQP